MKFHVETSNCSAMSLDHLIPKISINHINCRQINMKNSTTVLNDTKGIQMSNFLGAVV